MMPRARWNTAGRLRRRGRRRAVSRVASFDRPTGLPLLVFLDSGRSEGRRKAMGPVASFAPRDDQPYPGSRRGDRLRKLGSAQALQGRPCGGGGGDTLRRVRTFLRSRSRFAFYRCTKPIRSDAARPETSPIEKAEESPCRDSFQIREANRAGRSGAADFGGEPEAALPVAAERRFNDVRPASRDHATSLISKGAPTAWRKPIQPTPTSSRNSHGRGGS